MNLDLSLIVDKLAIIIPYLNYLFTTVSKAFDTLRGYFEI